MTTIVLITLRRDVEFLAKVLITLRRDDEHCQRTPGTDQRGFITAERDDYYGVMTTL